MQAIEGSTRQMLAQVYLGRVVNSALKKGSAGALCRWIAGRYSMKRLAEEFRRLYLEMYAGKRIKALTRS